jgi:oxygen-independent coproporphyrinogen-3 oxidase
LETAPEYVEKSESGESVRAESTQPDPVEEKFFVGLRLAEGVHPDESDWLRYGSAFERHLATGMMESADGRLRLTNRGIMVSNEIFQDFLAA